jgi:DNA-binding CsgD family transcriptional regulator
MADLNKELQRIEQGEAWDDTDEIVQVEVKKPLDKVIPIRLPAAEWEKLRKEARELGVGPTTLARMWILERMRLRSISPQDIWCLTQLFGASPFLRSPSLILTPREREVLSYIAQGYLNKQIAEKLDISEADIKNHTRAILEKLNSQSGVVVYAEPKSSVK